MWNGAQNQGTPHIPQSIFPVFHFSTSLGTALNNVPLINYGVSIYLYCKLLTGFSLLNYTCRVIISSLNLILNSRGRFSKFPVKILGLCSVNSVYSWDITPVYPIFIPPQMTPSITCPFLHDLSEMIPRHQLFVSHGGILLIPEHLFLQHSKHSLIIYSNCHGRWGVFATFNYNQTKWHIHRLSP